MISSYRIIITTYKIIYDSATTFNKLSNARQTEIAARYKYFHCLNDLTF